MKRTRNESEPTVKSILVSQCMSSNDKIGPRYCVDRRHNGCRAHKKIRVLSLKTLAYSDSFHVSYHKSYIMAKWKYTLLCFASNIRSVVNFAAVGNLRKIEKIRRRRKGKGKAKKKKWRKGGGNENLSDSKVICRHVVTRYTGMI